MEDGKRSFSVKEIRKPGQKNKSGSLKKTKSASGRFVSNTPEGAARKAFTASCRAKKIKGQCTLLVTLTETTRGSSGKEYKYKLKRSKLTKPLIVNRGGTDVKIEYETTSTSMN